MYSVLPVLLFVSPLGAQEPALRDQVSGTTARLQAVSVVSPRIVWVSGARGTYARTLDGGETWRAGVVPGADSLEFRDVEALSADTAWLLAAGPGDRSRIYRTTDGGVTWTLQFRNTEPRAFFDCLSFWDGRRGLAVSDAVDGAFLVIRTEDAGAHWEPLPAVGPTGASWSPDGGRSWRPLDDRNYWSVGVAADGTGWMVGLEGRITGVRVP